MTEGTYTRVELDRNREARRTGTAGGAAAQTHDSNGAARRGGAQVRQTERQTEAVHQHAPLRRSGSRRWGARAACREGMRSIGLECSNVADLGLAENPSQTSGQGGKFTVVREEGRKTMHHHKGGSEAPSPPYPHSRWAAPSLPPCAQKNPVAQCVWR